MPSRCDDDRVSRRGELNSDWESLYRRFAPRGVRYAYSVLRSQVDAEESVHDAFCRLLGSRRWRHVEFEEDEFAGVFFKTLRNVSIDVIRKRNRERFVSTELTNEIADRRVGPFDGLEDELNVIRELLEDLPQNWSDALRLRTDGDLSYQEIANVMDCTLAQVRTWIYRARQRLASQLRRNRITSEVVVAHDSL